ncbi:glycosyltransferase family 2 protein [Nocardioides sp. WS12]|uniref:glycosyltransferase family 2 protein n=1 Tax=Nocardioides sp. WS12 TaxID=2486272 RepID=UPI0015FCB018|nr:glycosyltransferase family 2 protein [Nocardioides sp. WS12]
MGTPAVDVTVIIPVYNTVDYLSACLDSLVGQTIGHERLEVVAVDDGSTDGSGELLEKYAASYSGVVRVFHQENSGGPARPCNAGLEHATGRYVFFLGSDDYLALDALERLVQRADQWQADVVVPVAEGVNGRHVDQRLFGSEHPDLAYPGTLLPYSLSNTKLYRRDLVVEHGLRYPLDLRVGSDQPFTLAALRAARRIGVLGAPTAYFAVKRTDDSNISYNIDWPTRLADLTAVVEHLCEIEPEGDDRDALLVRHFSWEFDKLITRDLPQLSDEDGAGLVAALAVLAERYLTEGVRRRLIVPRRIRWHHVVAGDLAAVRASSEEAPPIGQLLVDAGGAFRRLPGFRDGLPDDLFAIPQGAITPWTKSIETDATVRLDGHTITLIAETTTLDPASAQHARLTLSPVNEGGEPREALDLPPADGPPVLASAPVTIDADGAVRAEIDLAPFVERGIRRAGLRLRFETDGRTIDRPIRVPVSAVSEVATPSRKLTVTVTSSTENRVLVDVAVPRTLARRAAGRLRREFGRLGSN